MRIRNVKGAKEKVSTHPKVVQAPEEHKGKWHQLFGNNNPIHIEIGMGKGQFIINHATNNANINYIGIEYMTNVLFKALDKVDKVLDMENFKLIRMSAEDLLEVFEINEIDRIYLNFSDPWPKERHAKKRLTHSRLLAKYEVILKNKGMIVFKTDNRPLFDYSLEEIKNYSMEVNNVSYDLHSSKFALYNIMTEYEQKFTAKGVSICMLEAINIK